MDEDFTELLCRWSEGDEEALDKLMPTAYAELLQIARAFMNKERAGHTLQPTALVNEAFIKLVDQRRVRWQNRAHFLSIAARLMRRILVDHARRHQAAKRGGTARNITLTEGLASAPPVDVDLLVLDEALRALARMDGRQARLVEFRYFGGLSIKETAKVLGISPATVKREWSSAKAWLHRELVGR